jgi:BirA family biotin operon repressor/biotin-[acetyl-CoA-carboxylase] ligase
MIVRLRSTTSTMTDAAALATRGRPHGTVVVAEEQTGGIGRHGHSWHSGPDGGLYFSIILRLSLAPADLPALTMALGLAVQKAVDDFANVACDLRWPNDVLLNERKLAGILVQSTETNALIAGIGLNVNQTTFPEDLRAIATSLRIETGREHSKDALLDRVVAESLLAAQLSKPEILKQFSAHSTYISGKEVEVDGRIRGITAGLDADGFLLLNTSAGIERIVSGGVRPV